MNHRLLLGITALAMMTACTSYRPTEDEIQERNRELIEYCLEMQEEIDDYRRDGKALRQATTQERYNQECLGRTYPEPGTGP